MERLLKSKYKVTEKVGEDQYSITYKGYCLDDEQPIVVKIYRRGYLNSHLIKVLKEKIAFLAALEHAHIARVLDGDYGWQGFYFIREFVEGKSLREYLQAKKFLFPDEVVKITIQLAEALTYAHQKGIVHGSLSPENVFLSSPNQVKIANLALDGMIKGAFSDRAKIVLSDARYLAPEQIRGERDKKSADIYTLGILMHEMLVGEPPFGGEDNLKIALGHLRDKPKAVGRLKERMPKFLEEIIFKALEKDSILRFLGAQDIVESLRRETVVVRGTDLGFSSLIRYQEGEKEEKMPEAAVSISQSGIKKLNMKWAIFITAILMVVLFLGYGALKFLARFVP